MEDKSAGGGRRGALCTHVASRVTVSPPQQHHAHHLAVAHLGRDPQWCSSILWEKEVASVPGVPVTYPLMQDHQISESKRSTLRLICTPKRGGEEAVSEHGIAGWRLQCLGDLKPFMPILSYTKGLFPFLFRDRTSGILDWMQTHYIPEDDQDSSS